MPGIRSRLIPEIRGIPHEASGAGVLYRISRITGDPNISGSAGYPPGSSSPSITINEQRCQRRRSTSGRDAPDGDAG
jgi:hypothetical protein